VLLALAYYLTARLSLRLALVNEVVTPIWPPTGIALVALLRFGSRLWPAVTVAAFLVNATISPTIPAAVIIAAGNTLAPLLAAALLRAAGFRFEIDRLRDALALVVLGALLAMTVSASFGTGALWLSGARPAQGLPATWSVWWAGDATGILVFAPLLLSLRPPRWENWGRRSEAGALVVALGVVGYFAFHNQLRIAYLVFPVLIWAAVRFGQLGASVAALIVVGMAVDAAIDEAGMFGRTTLLGRMLTLQSYNAVVALTSFVLAAAMTERIKAQERRLGEAQALARVLQRSLLPERLPDIPGVALAGRYLPGSAGLEVGGDWYDVFVLPGGRVALTIGDVVGRGLGAATAMGQLRTALRAYALDGSSPAAVLERLSGLVRELDVAQMATLVYAVLDPETRRLRFASAGHPPALLAGPLGAARFLEEGRSPPLGVTGSVPREAEVVLEPGATLLLYTDGLVEKRGQSIDTGMEALRQLVAGHDGDLDSLCDDRILEALQPAAPADDVALLALRLVPVAAGTELRLNLPAEPGVLASLRRSLRQWLGGLGATPDEVHDLVLACDEAATNVVEHAYGPADGLLEVEATGSGAVVSLVVRDRGQWRSPREDGRGRGFLLMNALVDEVEVRPGPEGTEVRLRRELGRALGEGPPGPPLPPTFAATSTEAPVEVARFEGDIDLPRARELEPELFRAVGNEALGLVVDLSGVRHIDSAGVRLLFQLAARLELRRQRLAVVVPTGSSVRRVLDLVGLDASAQLAPTVDEAITGLRRSQPPMML
jgi:anti-anti-sigma factor